VSCTHSRPHHSKLGGHPAHTRPRSLFLGDWEAGLRVPVLVYIVSKERRCKPGTCGWPYTPCGRENRGSRCAEREKMIQRRVQRTAGTNREKRYRESPKSSGAPTPVGPEAHPHRHILGS